MIAFAPWQSLLDGLGWVIAQIYSLIPNYGVTIIVLTVVIRLILLPLGIKQIRSMQHMQLVQPKVKQVQQKYKQNKAKQQEEIMKLYKEYGVKPLLRVLAGPAAVPDPYRDVLGPAPSAAPGAHPGREPTPSSDAAADPPADPTSVAQLPTEPGPSGGTSFLGMNLLCSATQAGTPNAELGRQPARSGVRRSSTS